MPESPIGDIDPARLRAWRAAQRMAAAITTDSPEAAGFAAFGDGTYLAFPQGVLDGVHRIVLGARCVINEYVTLSAGFPGDETPGPSSIRIGDGVVLGRRCELHAMESIVVGNDVQCGPDVKVFDHNHTSRDPDVPIGHQLPLQVASVEIGAGSWIGAGATILAGARIGRHTTVGAGAVVPRGDYPAHATLLGIPARPSTRPVTAPAGSTLDDMAEPAGKPEAGETAAKLGLTGTITTLQQQAREQAGNDEALYHRMMATLLYDKWASVSYHVTSRQCTTATESKQADLLITLAIDHRYAAHNIGR